MVLSTTSRRLGAMDDAMRVKPARAANRMAHERCTLDSTSFPAMMGFTTCAGSRLRSTWLASASAARTAVREAK